jgi:YVTN family beta-propeller protein
VHRFRLLGTGVLIVALLAGCSGGGGGSTTPTSPTQTSSTPTVGTPPTTSPGGTPPTTSPGGTPPTTSPGGTPTSKIVQVGTFTQGVEVFFKLVFTDPNKVATGFGFKGAKGAGWAEANFPFSSPSYGSVVLSPGGGTVQYPFNLACGTTAQYESDVEAWINDTGGQRSQSVIVHLACKPPTNPAGPPHIYVSNPGSNTVTTYDANGTQTSLTITAGLSVPSGIAVDASGKIYVTNPGNNTVTTYTANGTQTAPTITKVPNSTTGGLSNPIGVAVDATGHIYVINDTVLLYNSDGTGAGQIYQYNSSGIAIDAIGKVYVANGNNVSTFVYDTSWTQTTPRITGPNNLQGVAVDAKSKIYVVNQSNNTVTTYNPDGTAASPTITGLNKPQGVAVDASGNIYVTNQGNNTVTTYNANGAQIAPTISTGLSNPLGIAIH